ncbi:MAG: hypothetical protein CBB96_03630 [Gammaproteobacteria bacterium TMED36]|nr:MAG: hypothetical protein CBB96_03630 [Gammaproteobacteria bacterium TMED36]|tara:strand:+ start:1374 stop:2108 length:735 start_codon:yes stop_codon:yes gene_type:complete
MIVCEVGLNHLGNEEYSNKYLEYLSNSKCDAITYQIREPKFYKSDKYKNFELSMEHYQKVIDNTDKKVGFAISNPDLLKTFNDMGSNFFKVLSWDLTNYRYIDRLLNETEKPIHISTGTSSIEDIDKFFNRYGYNKRISLIHTQLTQKPEDANLKSISFLKNRYSYGIGFGNHSDNLNVIYGAVPFDPQDIWFYVKAANYNWRFHPDEFWSVILSDVDKVIGNIEAVKSSIGNGMKTSINAKGY